MTNTNSIGTLAIRDVARSSTGTTHAETGFGITACGKSTLFTMDIVEEVDFDNLRDSVTCRTCLRLTY